RFGVLFERREVLDPIPGDVDGHGRTDAGVALDLGRILKLLERVTGDTRLGEHLETRPRISVPPGGGLDPLRPQPLLDCPHIDSLGRDSLGHYLVGASFSFVHPYPLSLCLQGWSRRSETHCLETFHQSVPVAT